MSPDIPTKVLIIACTGPSPDRPHQAVFVQRWAQQLAEAGCEIRVFTRRHITFGTYIKEWPRIREYYATQQHFHYDWDGIPVYGRRIHLRLPLNYSRSATRLTLNAIRTPLHDLFREFPFDLMYMATWGDFSLAAAGVAKELGVPYIASAIGNYVNRFYNKPNSLPYCIQRELYEGSKLVLCVSNDLNRKVQSMTDGIVPTVTWDSGVDTRHFTWSKERREQRRRELGVAKDEILFTFVGRLVKEKGIYELINAFAVISKEYPKSRLLLVGDTSEKSRILRKIKTQGIHNKVQLAGGVPATDIVNFLNATDIFVFPSWHEGLPNVVKEASACGLPIVATEVGGIPDVIENGVSGLLVPPDAPANLIGAIRKLVVDSTLRSRLGAAALKHVHAKFDYYLNGKLLAAMFKKIIADSHHEIISSSIEE